MGKMAKMKIDFSFSPVTLKHKKAETHPALFAHEKVCVYFSPELEKKKKN